jgi:hypothetical protein
MLNVCYCRCFDIFTPEEQKILKKYREENFAPKKLVYKERRAIGKCPLTPEEVEISFILINLYLFLSGKWYTC